MKPYNIFVFILIFSLFIYSDYVFAEDEFENKENLSLVVEGHELTPVPMDIIKRAAYYEALGGLYRTIEEKRLGALPNWDSDANDINGVVVYPIYDIEGRIIYYEYVAYIGEGDRPESVGDIIGDIRDLMLQWIDVIFEDDLITEKKPPIDVLKEFWEKMDNMITERYIHGLLSPYYEYGPGESAANLGVGNWLLGYWYAKEWAELYILQDINFSRPVVAEFREGEEKRAGMFYCFSHDEEEYFVWSIKNFEVKLMSRDNLDVIGFKYPDSEKLERNLDLWRRYEEWSDEELRNWKKEGASKIHLLKGSIDKLEQDE